MVSFFIAFAKVGGRADRIAEWAIKRTGIFGAVGHDARVDVAVFFEGIANRADAPVHHVAWSHDVYARVSLREGLLGQHLYGDVIEDIARLI